jgi:hypothetical protein
MELEARDRISLTFHPCYAVQNCPYMYGFIIELALSTMQSLEGITHPIEIAGTRWRMVYTRIDGSHAGRLDVQTSSF